MKRTILLTLALTAAVAFAPLTPLRAAASRPPTAVSFPRGAIARFIDHMVVVHRFSRAELLRLFATVHPLSRVLALVHAPAEALPWRVYRHLLVTPARVRSGRAWMRAHAQALAQASAASGVPAAVIAAILGVESNYGENIGSIPALDSLATLAFADPGRAAFFRHELSRYLILCRRYGFDPRRLVGSYAGALGIPQFMPSTYLRYAVSARPGRLPNLFVDSDDAIVSVSHYLALHGWRRGAPIARALPRGSSAWPASRLLALSPAPGGRRICLNAGHHHDCWLTYHNFRVLMSYNASWLYVLAVDLLAHELARPGS